MSTVSTNRDATYSNNVDNVLSPIGAAAGSRSNALSNKLTSALSSSYADPEIRTALGLLDARGVKNDTNTRRDLRLDAQKQVIDCNVQVVEDFGRVAEVRSTFAIQELPDHPIATTTRRHALGQPEQDL